MLLEIIIAAATLLVALNGLLYQPKKDPEQRGSWKNLNLHGRVLLALLLTLTVLGLLKVAFTVRSAEREAALQEERIAKSDEEIQSLLASQDDLKRINQHLIKVMSVADGYNAAVSGVVSFDRPLSESRVRDALRNLFLKYAEIEITTRNPLGEYAGRINYGTHPEVRRFLSLDSLEPDSAFDGFRRFGNRYSYYFEIRCSKLKILNDDRIQYAKFEDDEPIHLRVKTFSWSKDFSRIYHVERIYVHEVTFEELGEVRVEEVLNF